MPVRHANPEFGVARQQRQNRCEGGRRTHREPSRGKATTWVYEAECGCVTVANEAESSSKTPADCVRVRRSCLTPFIENRETAVYWGVRWDVWKGGFAGRGFRPAWRLILLLGRSFEGGDCPCHTRSPSSSLPGLFVPGSAAARACAGGGKGKAARGVRPPPAAGGGAKVQDERGKEGP